MHVLLLTLIYIIALFFLLSGRALAQSTCVGYDREAAARCTSSFPSLLHIDAVEGNTELDTRSERQAVYPELTFRCNGTLRLWTIGADWTGYSTAYTELQLWRRTSPTVLSRIASTTLLFGTENRSQLYEFRLDPPLNFQEGDFLGYFQPRSNEAEVNLYLEDSGRLRGFQISTSTAQQTFDTFRSTVESRHPLVIPETDPPDCGCGFMTLERLKTLLDIIPLDVGSRRTYRGRQFIFPSITFTCSGELVEWVMGGEMNDDEAEDGFPELQIWRPSGDSVYQRIHSTRLFYVAFRRNFVYRFTLSPPVLFEPGDILGVYQPSGDEAGIDVHYDSEGMEEGYSLSTRRGVTVISTNLATMRSALPLVSVEIVPFPTTTTTSTANSPTANFDVRPFTLLTTRMSSTTSLLYTAQPTPTTVIPSQQFAVPTPVDIDDKNLADYLDALTFTQFVIVCVMCISVALLFVIVFVALVICVWKRCSKTGKKSSTVLHHNTVEGSSQDLILNEAYAPLPSGVEPNYLLSPYSPQSTNSGGNSNIAEYESIEIANSPTTNNNGSRHVSAKAVINISGIYETAPGYEEIPVLDSTQNPRRGSTSSCDDGEEAIYDDIV